MLECKIPSGCSPEKSYIITQVLKRWLGLEVSFIFDDGTDYRISMPTHEETIILPDYFFSQFDEVLLSGATIEGETDEFWQIPSYLMSQGILNPTIPRYFEKSECQGIVDLPDYEIPIDIFGVCFFLLSRMEEYGHQGLDQHDRFSAYSSRNYCLGVLDRPIADELTELLWNAMSSRWPHLSRKKESFSIELSHDVDHPSRYKFCSFSVLLKRFAKDAILNGEWKPCITGLVSRVKSAPLIASDDPYYNFDWIMNQSEIRGLKSTFFFMCGGSHPLYDPDYPIASSELKSLLISIDSRGHYSGIHPSFYCFDNKQVLNKEVNIWESIVSNYILRNGKTISRMHYLRFSTEITPKLLEDSGVTDDYTMGYADHVGFRAGTCKQFQFFSIPERRELSLNVKPLCAMEVSVLGYMGKTYKEAYESFMQIKRACMSVNGTFSLLWHNSELVSKADRELYLAIVDGN